MIDDETALARNSVGILSEVGLADLVADSTDDYIAIASTLSRDLGRLAQLRRELRDRMAASCLTDAAGFAADLESAYRSMWRHYCAL